MCSPKMSSVGSLDPEISAIKDHASNPAHSDDGAEEASSAREAIDDCTRMLGAIGSKFEMQVHEIMADTLAKNEHDWMRRL